MKTFAILALAIFLTHNAFADADAPPAPEEISREIAQRPPMGGIVPPNPGADATAAFPIEPQPEESRSEESSSYDD